MSITLADAQANLDRLVKASAAWDGKASFSLTTDSGQRSYTYRSLKELETAIDYWQRKVNTIKAASDRRRSSRYAVATFND